jgi:hypothetical protein
MNTITQQNAASAEELKKRKRQIRNWKDVELKIIRR